MRLVVIADYQQILLSKCIMQALAQDPAISSFHDFQETHLGTNEVIPPVGKKGHSGDEVSRMSSDGKPSASISFGANDSLEVRSARKGVSSKAKDIENGLLGSRGSGSGPKEGRLRGGHDPFEAKIEGGVNYKCMAWWYARLLSHHNSLLLLDSWPMRTT